MAHVFLTGATGFIGGATAWRLLHDPRVESVLALVRGPRAEERLNQSVSRFGDFDRARLRVLEGELLKFELEPTALDQLTHVIHCAACTSFRSIQRVRRDNVEGVAALAEQLEQAPRLLRVVHVGTAFSCGQVQRAVVREDDPPAARQIVDYTQSKAEGEALMLETALPVVVARPSIVIGHTRLGVAPSASLYWYYRGMAEAGVSSFGDDHRRDIVPVDYVADALVHLAFATLSRRCFHVSAGEASAVPFGEIRRALGGVDCEVVEPAQLAAHPRWDRVGADAAFRTGVEMMSHFASAGVQWFDNTRLIDSGMPPPPPFTSYLERCRQTSRATVRQQLTDDE